MKRPWQPPSDDLPAIDVSTGQRLLQEHTDSLLGPPPPERNVRIMVTMPGEAADDYTLVHGLLKQGMNCMTPVTPWQPPSLRPPGRLACLPERPARSASAPARGCAAWSQGGLSGLPTGRSCSRKTRDSPG